MDKKTSLLPKQNECIVIDTSNNRIGINNVNPEYSLDISHGDIQCRDIRSKNLFVNGTADISNVKEISMGNNSFKIKFEDDIIVFENSRNIIRFDSFLEKY